MTAPLLLCDSPGLLYRGFFSVPDSVKGADGRPVNEFEDIIERGLDRLPRVGLWVDPTGLEPHRLADLLLDRQSQARWVAGISTR